jgi:hypothetical protein
VALSYKNQQRCQLLSTMAIILSRQSEHMSECLITLADFSQRIPTLLVDFDNNSKTSSEILKTNRLSALDISETELVAQICKNIINFKSLTA